MQVRGGHFKAPYNAGEGGGDQRGSSSSHHIVLSSVLNFLHCLESHRFPCMFFHVLACLVRSHSLYGILNSMACQPLLRFSRWPFATL